MPERLRQEFLLRNNVPLHGGDVDLWVFFLGSVKSFITYPPPGRKHGDETSKFLDSFF